MSIPKQADKLLRTILERKALDSWRVFNTLGSGSVMVFVPVSAPSNAHRVTTMQGLADQSGLLVMCHPAYQYGVPLRDLYNPAYDDWPTAIELRKLFPQ